MPTIAAERTHVFHLYVIRCEERDALQEHLNSAGISTMVNYSRALPFYPAYAYLGHKAEDFPNAFANQRRILSIPIYPEMKDSMIQRVAFEIQNFQKCRS
jgi:dTDP-4-amino-4,6-dideoxygalactose transaminase